MNNLYTIRKLKTMTMTIDEVITHRQALKYKLWCNIESGRNNGYVEYLEREIKTCDDMIKTMPKKLVA
jgi:hypothetical protein